MWRNRRFAEMLVRQRRLPFQSTHGSEASDDPFGKFISFGPSQRAFLVQVRIRLSWWRLHRIGRHNISRYNSGHFRD